MRSYLKTERESHAVKIKKKRMLLLPVVVSSSIDYEVVGERVHSLKKLSCLRDFLLFCFLFL